jgi:hypothetical protein
MIKEGITPFPKKDHNDPYKTCLLELIGNSINYCYWYGRSDIRPGDASSTKMYELLEEAFQDYSNNTLRGNFVKCIYKFITLLSLNRFPLLEEREKHLKELIHFGEDYISVIIKNAEDNQFEDLFTVLIGAFSGYSSDIFLKRASLFFIQLYRNFGWFKDSMSKIHVPADYQVPKMFYHYNCTHYSEQLNNKIFANELVLKNSREECEIRSATILICRKLCELTGWNISDIDGWLWLKRNEATHPFHLTITTDY